MEIEYGLTEDIYSERSDDKEFSLDEKSSLDTEVDNLNRVNFTKGLQYQIK